MGKRKQQGATIWLPDRKTRDEINRFRQNGETIAQMLKRRLGF